MVEKPQFDPITFAVIKSAFDAIVISPYGDIIICPNRLYANNYHALQRVSEDAFGSKMPFLMYEQFLKERATYIEQRCLMASNACMRFVPLMMNTLSSRLAA